MPETPWFGGDIAHKAKHAAEHVAHEAEHAGKEAGHAAEHAGELVGEQLEHAVMASLDDIKHLADGLKKDLEKTADEGKDAIEKAGHAAEGKVWAVEKTAEHWVDKHGQDAIDATKKVLNESGDGWKKIIDQTVSDAKADIEKIAKSEAAELTAEALEKGLAEAHKVAVAAETFIEKMEDKAPTIVDMLNNQSLPINLGPLVLTYANGIGRVKDIADALGKVTGQDFKLTQVFINDILHGLGPDTISIHADVEFFVEVGLDLDDIPFAAFVEVADLVFDAIGIPKD